MKRKRFVFYLPMISKINFQLHKLNSYTENFEKVFFAFLLLLALQLAPHTLFPNIENNFANSFPIAKEVALYKVFVPITSYNAVAAQTDDTPCITANGFNLCEATEENVVAANFVPLGTRIKIPELYGEKVFTVVDRMNPRFKYKVDIWKKEIADSRDFGLKFAYVEVYKN